MPSEQDIIEQFRRAMADEKIVVEGEIIADGVIHRTHATGDNKGSKNVWYCIHIDQSPAGQFGCNKRYGEKVKFSWSLKGQTPLTPAERKAFAIRMAEAKSRRAAEEAARHADAAQRANDIWQAGVDVATHPYLARKGVKSHGLRVGEWPVTNTETGEISVACTQALLVPIRDLAKKIHSLQAVFPDKKNFLKRDKDFLAGGRKQGLFFTIGKPVEKTFVLGEGYATCATIHEVTGHAVVVCFDRGNLAHVARALREKFPDYRIIIAADNDQWTLEPIVNPGLTAAREAAIAIGGLLAVPPFADTEVGNTDFNDLAALRGVGAVLAEFMAPFDPSIKEPEAAPVLHLVGLNDVEPPAPDDGLPPVVKKNPYFAMLGYDHDRYYIFNYQKRQIVVYTKGDFSDAGLIEMAPLNWWEGHFSGGAKGGIDKRAAMNVLVQIAHGRGIYDISRIRGRGAWTDKGRIVFHHGDHLTVDGVATDITELESRFVYELGKSMPDMAPVAMSDADGRMLLEFAAMFRWSKAGSSALLAGWVALAPICGAVKWRPHVWIGGGAGSGKSTALNEYVHHLMNGCDLFAQGSSTEAGIRQELKGDALPVLFDESESNNERESLRIQSVLALARQASSESQAKTYKGTAGGDAQSFHIRSMFCMASIQIGTKLQADMERVTVLALKPKDEDEDAAATWKIMDDRIHAMQRDETLPGRLFRRALTLLPITLQNIRIFAEVAATKFGSQRDGDQYGTLLAGAYSLVSDKLATYADAAELIEKYDWSEHRENVAETEGSRAIAALMEAHVRVPGGVEVSVNELIRAAKGYEVNGMIMAEKTANAMLGRQGMRVDGMRLLLSNTSQQLKALMKDTPFATDLRGVLMRTKGALRVDKPIKFSGALSRCISIPIDDFLDGDEIEPLSTGTDGRVSF